MGIKCGADEGSLVWYNKASNDPLIQSHHNHIYWEYLLVNLFAKVTDGFSVCLTPIEIN